MSGARPLSALLGVCVSYQTSAAVDKKGHGSALVDSACAAEARPFLLNFSLRGLVIQAFVWEWIQTSIWRLGKALMEAGVFEITLSS